MMMSLFPDVTEIIDDPELGGGQQFTVLRGTVKNGRGGTTRTTEALVATGNVQPSSSSDLQLSETEDRNSPSIVIRSKFTFQMGNAMDGGYTEPDQVQVWGHVWKINRLDDWNMWGFTTAWFVLRKDGVVDAGLPGSHA